jgi:cell wall-associated NlpC family hydrolase
VAAVVLAGFGFTTLVAATTHLEKHATAPAATVARPAAVEPAPASGVLHAPRPPAEAPRPAWVAVSVASLWDTPRSPRSIDVRALGSRVDISAWIRSETVGQRLGLVYRLLTQAVLGERVVVLGHRGAWSRVRVPLQRGSGFPHGIVGWVPTRQLDFSPPATDLPTATVSIRSLTLAPGLKAGYGTVLPVVAHSRTSVTVEVPRHGGVRLPRSSVSLAPPRRATGLQVVQEARRFLGVPYLWAGMSAYGVDCSGLTYRVYQRLGHTLARNASDQAAHGKPIDKRHLQPGDLVFFGTGSRNNIHHVGIYAGHGLVLNAPRTGRHVELTPLSRWGDYWGARRYLPAS